MAAFACVSALDFLLTWALIREGAAVEANPLAGDILARFGWLGLGLFKAGAVAVVLLLGVIIRSKSRRAARRLLQVGCSIVVLVVAYSSCLLVRVEINNRVLAAAKQRSVTIVQNRQSAQICFGRLDQLTGELLLGKVTLPQAAGELARFLEGASYDPFPHLQVAARGFNRQGALAVQLLRHAGYYLLETPDEARRLLPRWKSEFAYTFYGPLPAFALEFFPKEDKLPDVITLHQSGGFQHGPAFAQE